MDFAAELHKLIEAEDTPPADPLAELALAQAELLSGIQKNSADISLQVEEIYDIVKEADENAREVKAAAKRENLLLGSLVSVSDLLDSLLQYMKNTDTAHAGAIAAKMDEAMTFCGLERFGSPGERLDPQLHTVVSVEYSSAPVESVTRVLESGYAYRGKVIRKAAVIVSKGVETQ